MKPNDGSITEETVTPTAAAVYLKTMVTNRKLSHNRAIEYAVAMDADQWVVNGETIKFDDAGRLFDGQHRLQACVLAGKPFKTFVARGISDERAFSTVDTGKTRTGGDIFSIYGIPDANNAAATARIYYWYKHSRLTVRGPLGAPNATVRKMVKGRANMQAVNIKGPSKDELLEFALPLKARLAEAMSVTRSSGSLKVVTMPYAAAPFMIFSEKSEEDAHQFFDAFGSGVGLNANDPVYLLRERLLAARHSNYKMSPYAGLALTIKAWNKRRAGEKLKQLKMGEDEAFPRAE